TLETAGGAGTGTADTVSVAAACSGAVLRTAPTDNPAPKITSAAAACAHAGNGARHHAIFGSRILAARGSSSRVMRKPSAKSGGVHDARVRRVALNASISLAQAAQ